MLPRQSTDKERPLVLHVLHSMAVGGAEVLVDRIVRQMSDKFRFAIACLDSIGSLGDRLKADDVPVIDLGRKPGVDVRCIRRLRRHIHQLSAAVVHAHQYTPYFYSVASRFPFSQVPIIFTEHGRHHPDTRKTKRVVFNRLTSRHRDRIVGVGHAVKQALVANEGFPERAVSVIYNGVPTRTDEETAEVATIRRDFELPEDAFVIVQVARLDYLKDHLTAAKAFLAVARNVPNVYWLVVGAGPKRHQLEEFLTGTPYAKQVRFTGERSDVARILRASDLMLLSSISEGIPLTLIEGMLAQLPIVSTNVGGVSEVIRDGVDGLLAPAESSTELANSIEELIRDKPRREGLAASGYSRASQEFTESKMHEQYARLYDELGGKVHHLD